MKTLIAIALAGGALTGCIQQRAEPLGNCVFICNLEQSQIENVQPIRETRERFVFK